MGERLEQQVAFLVEIDRLKGVLRQTLITGSERRENSAEHSWQFALAALLLAEHANEPVDALKAARMALVHDLVEIDAGDTFVYDTAARVQQAEREQAAADRIFALLPADQAAELRALWDEFEAGATPEARYAKALDRLLPVLLNYHSRGHAWRAHGVTADRVRAVNSRMAEGSAALWDYASALIDRAVADGYLHERSEG
ncbi:MAG: HD domain-containing protein [Armatimonadetes bacterium]|nr:HD domain-containing protein [Armatimonadota bacterium]